MKLLKRRAKIIVNTNQAAKVTLEFVPGSRPYIHVDAQYLTGYDRVTGFIDDKDVEKFKRMVNSLKIRKHK